MALRSCQVLPCVAFVSVMSIAVSSSAAPAGSATAVSAQTVYGQLETLHGHVCAGSLFGARLGLAASQALKRAGGTGKFSARYYDLSCPLDGIQVAAGTTYGNRALTVQDRDQHRLLLSAGGNGRQVEARVTEKAEQLGLRSRELSTRAQALPIGSPERLELERENEAIFTWLKTAPDNLVVIVTVVADTKGAR